MSDQVIAIVAATVAYKVTALIVATVICWMGYRLFAKGIFGDAGELESSLKDGKLSLKAAAPGTFFAVLGALVLVVTIFQGFTVDLSGVLKVDAAEEVAR